MTAFYQRIAVLGLGLIGSSVVRAAQDGGLAHEVAVYDADKAVRDKARKLGLGGEISEAAADAVRNADLVILAVPVGVMAALAAEIAPQLKAGAVVIDTGSTKASVIGDVAPILPESVHFIPSHPVAGTEYSGPEAGFASLFIERYWIIIDDGIPPEVVAELTAFLQEMGAMVESMTAEYHDMVMAITSHLPHLIAYTIVGTAFDVEQKIQHDVLRFSASGFRDFTRIAASDPVMWRDVFLNNREAVLDMLAHFNADLASLTQAIDKGEGDKLQRLFTRTRAIRTRIRDIGQLD